MGQQNPVAPLVKARLQRWNAQHPNHQIDLKALEAVGGQEGYSGRIGDNGHAFGPWQLNNAGGVITGMFPGQSPEQIQQWAVSPAGIDFALNHIGSVAGGLRGPAAVRSIVNRFERPADPNHEIAGALAAYGYAPGGAGATLPPAPAAAGTYAPGVAALPPAPRSRPIPIVPLEGGDYSNFYSELGAHYRSQQQPLPLTPVAPQLEPPPSRVAPQPAVGGIAKTALTQLGTPYQWGGPAKLGSRTDCSGLLQASARANGIDIGRTTYEQYRQGTAVPLNRLRPGDAVFSEPTARGPGHVAIYIGGGRVVEDPHTGASVRIRTLEGKRGIVGARRYG